jgi:hypothetical protein
LQSAVLVKLIDKTFADQFVYHGIVGDGFHANSLLPHEFDDGGRSLFVSPVARGSKI